MGGFFSTPPKNFSHSIWTCRIIRSSVSKSSSAATAQAPSPTKSQKSGSHSSVA